MRALKVLSIAVVLAAGCSRANVESINHMNQGIALNMSINSPYQVNLPVNSFEGCDGPIRSTEVWRPKNYDTGLSGFAIGASSRMLWRDLSNTWQDYSFGGARNDVQVPLEASNRTIVAESRGQGQPRFAPSARGRSRDPEP